MKVYPEYKESNIEWLGKVPEGWTVKRVKWLCNVKRGQSPRPIDDASYFDENGEYAWVRISDVTASEKYLYQTEQKLSELGSSKSVKLEPNELFVSIAATVGKPIINKIKCCIHDGFVWLEGLEESKEFMYFVFSGGELYKGLGKLGTQLNLNSEYIANIYIPVPPKDEQKIIVKYLENKTAQIDALIEKKQRQIELLQEQRTALINHAVTKGQRKDDIYQGRNLAPWLFPLPTGWNRQALKYNSYMKGRIGYQNLRSEEYTEEGPYLVSSAHFKDGSIEWDKCNHVTKERFEMAPEIILQEDDVLFMKDGALMGKLAYVNDLPGEACLNSHLLLMRPLNGSYLPRFLYYVFTTDIFEAYMIQERTGTTFFGLSQESMGNFPISLPPIDEQKEICKYLDEQTQKTKTAIEKINDGIIALQEYRTALISEAVTGKIDVRTVHE